MKQILKVGVVAVMVVLCVPFLTGCSGLSFGDIFKGGAKVDDKVKDDDDKVKEDEKFEPVSFADDSWATVAEVSATGEPWLYYSVGDEKDIEITTGEIITVQIWGFNHDDLSDGTGKAGITIGMKHLLEKTYQLTDSNTNAGGWQASQFRTVALPTILEQLPIVLRNAIKPVNKRAGNNGNQSGAALVTTTDNLFLFSQMEISSDNASSYTDGVQYDYWKNIKDGTVAANRIKHLANGHGAANHWWFRSPTSTSPTSFRAVNSINGGFSSNAGNNTLGICLGFCI